MIRGYTPGSTGELILFGLVLMLGASFFFNSLSKVIIECSNIFKILIKSKKAKKTIVNDKRFLIHLGIIFIMHVIYEYLVYGIKTYDNIWSLYIIALAIWVVYKLKESWGKK